MPTTLSRDGTLIAFNRTGTGPSLIVVDGALCYRAQGPSGEMAAHLAPHFTVFTYDRRGRGDSGNAATYAVEREVEDIDALIKEGGGSAFLYGVSSGAALALEAANRGLPVTKLALYEAPFIVDNARTPIPNDFVAQLETALASGDRGRAVRLFMGLVGVPKVFIAMMRFLPAWSKLKAVAHTLPYDILLVKDHEQGQPLSRTQWMGARMPTLVMDGGKSPAWMRNAMRALADVLPNATYRTLPGQTHMIKASAHVEPLVQFLRSPAVRPSEIG
jgi:pimeloyl-ACP methyl ester carboxylesterase